MHGKANVHFWNVLKKPVATRAHIFLPKLALLMHSVTSGLPIGTGSHGETGTEWLHQAMAQMPLASCFAASVNIAGAPHEHRGLASVYTPAQNIPSQLGWPSHQVHANEQVQLPMLAVMHVTAHVQRLRPQLIVQLQLLLPKLHGKHRLLQCQPTTTAMSCH